MQKMNSKGFTLLEILLVVAAIAILAGIVIVAINPSKQLAETRNAQRRVDVNTVLNAVYQYEIDNNGALPGTIPTIGASCAVTALSEICKTGGACAGFVDFSQSLTLLEKYLTAMPRDPSCAPASNGTCYRIVKTANGRITVCAPSAEGNPAPSIIVTR